MKLHELGANLNMFKNDYNRYSLENNKGDEHFEKKSVSTALVQAHSQKLALAKHIRGDLPEISIPHLDDTPLVKYQKSIENRSLSLTDFSKMPSQEVSGNNIQ